MTSQGKYSSANGCRLDRRFLSRMFGKKNARPDAECWALENFLRDTLAGCDVGLQSGNFYIDGPWDVCAFNKTVGMTRGLWQAWFADRENGWPVVEKQNDVYVWTWFKSSRQMGNWVRLEEDCPVIYKLVKREDGKGFNKVLIE